MSVNICGCLIASRDIRGNFLSLYWRRRVKDVRDATRTSLMGIRTLGTYYRRVMDINYRYGPQSSYRKIKQFYFSVASF